MLPEHLREIFLNGIFLAFCSLAHFSPCCSFPRSAALCPASAPARASFMLPSDCCLMTRNRNTGPGAETSGVPGNGEATWLGWELVSGLWAPAQGTWCGKLALPSSPAFLLRQAPPPPNPFWEAQLCSLGTGTLLSWPRVLCPSLRGILPGLCVFAYHRPSWPRFAEGRRGVRARAWPLTLSCSALVATRQRPLRAFFPEALCSVQ